MSNTITKPPLYFGMCLLHFLAFRQCTNSPMCGTVTGPATPTPVTTGTILWQTVYTTVNGAVAGAMSLSNYTIRVLSNGLLPLCIQNFWRKSDQTGLIGNDNPYCYVLKIIR